MTSNKTQPDTGKMDRIVAEARRNRDQREKDYREQALKIYPWVCGRCAREFTRANVLQLTVHHKDHNHDNNPPDGSNWELLCIYCHDHEHEKYRMAGHYDPTRNDVAAPPPPIFKPFEGLDALLKAKEGEAKTGNG